MDFGRNRAVKHQDEAKEAGFSAMQITVHPCVMYYNDESTNTKVRDSMIFLSDDIAHDYHAVSYFSKPALKHLNDERKIDFNRVFVYTDCCRAQYKGKGTVAALSNIDTPIEWSYFGSDQR